MSLIDIGVNLTNSSLLKNLDNVILQAKSVGVIHQIITGTSIKNSQQALQIADSNPSYFSSTAGCHPHDAKDFQTSDEDLLIQLSKHNSVVAIGECGLDFNRNFSPRESQERVFECQIDIACKTNLPLFMHQRDAHQQFIEMLSKYKDQYKSGVIHCFTGDKKQLKDCLDLGLSIGITGWLCDERRGSDLQDAIKYMPIERMMVETDAPYLMPRNIKPKPKSRINVPANLPWIVSKIADILGLEPEFIAKQTTENTRRFFALSN